MNFDKIVNGITLSGDPGAFLKKELEEGLEPITKRVDRLEEKIDMLISLMTRIDVTLKRVQPVLDVILKLPFFKK